MMFTTAESISSPEVIRPQEIRCRKALEHAAAYLGQTSRLIAEPGPAYGEVLASSLQSIRCALRGLLEWNNLPASEDATLTEVARPVVKLASMLRTCMDRTWRLEDMASVAAGGSGAPVAVREAAQASYYTARNTLLTVLSQLPERVGRVANARVRRAHVIRMAPSAPKDAIAITRAAARRSPATATLPTISTL